MQRAVDVQASLRAKIDHEPRYFKDGPGQYAEGDKFLGVKVPSIRVVAKQFKDLPPAEIEKLLQSEWHDERLCALFILAAQFKKANTAGKQAIYDFYMAHTECVNNWDLVDSSAHFILGPYLDGRAEKMAVLNRLAASANLWERRMAIVSTLYYSRKGSADEAMAIAKKLLHDKHDLIQKAVGWILRETGTKADKQALLAFLDRHAATMPRTALRYAVEHLTPEQRMHYMGLKGTIKA